MIERIPHCIWDGFRPFLEFFVTASVACDEFLWHTIASECSPLVVVTSQPYLGKVLELVVFRNHLRVKMAVVVDDRHALGTFMVKRAGILVCKHEIFMYERLFA